MNRTGRDESSARRSLARTIAIARKEIRHILRDRLTLAFALGMPVILLMLFGYAVRFDVDQIATIVVDHDRTPESRKLLSRFFSGETFIRAGDAPDASVAEQAFLRGDARCILVIPENYGRARLGGEAATVQLLVDAADNQSAGNILAYAGRFAALENTRIAASLPAAAEGAEPSTVVVEARAWFNPALRSSLFLVPGLIALIESMMTVLLTALTIAREWERGTMEQLFSTPVGRGELLAGKLAPYFLVAMLQFAFVVATAMLLFEVPVRGSLALLTGVSALFALAMLGQGMLISVVTKNQMVATQVAAITSMLPSMLLSGFVIPIDGMPEILQLLTRIIPARYFVHAARSIMLRGAGLETVALDVLALAVVAVFFLTVALARFQRRLS